MSNPNHDSKGQFSSGSGGKSLSHKTASAEKHKSLAPPTQRQAVSAANAKGSADVHRYNAIAVDQAISQSERRGGEVNSKGRSVIHALLKGRG